MKLFALSLYSLKLSMDNVTVYTEIAYNSSNSTNSTQNLNRNRKSRLSLHPLETITITVSQREAICHF